MILSKWLAWYLISLASSSYKPHWASYPPGWCCIMLPWVNFRKWQVKIWPIKLRSGANNTTWLTCCGLNKHSCDRWHFKLYFLGRFLFVCLFIYLFIHLFIYHIFIYLSYIYLLYIYLYYLFVYSLIIIYLFIFIYLFIKISLECVPGISIGNKSALLQVISLCWLINDSLPEAKDIEALLKFSDTSVFAKVYIHIWIWTWYLTDRQYFDKVEKWRKWTNISYRFNNPVLGPFLPTKIS